MFTLEQCNLHALSPPLMGQSTVDGTAIVNKTCAQWPRKLPIVVDGVLQT